MPRSLTTLSLAASLMLPILSGLALAPGSAWADDASAKTGAVAYPDNPSGTPQADNNGAPVVTDKAACPSGSKCADKPAPSATADSATTGGNAAQSGGVRTPATAYPDSPVPTPATVPNGTAPKR